MAGASILVHVTHIDDSARGRQGPCIYFWGITHDRSKYLLMEKYLEIIRHYLEKRPPPLNLKLLDRVCCVLINHHWLRARVLQPKLSDEETIEVICIDYGDTHTVPLAFVRTLDIPGTEAEHVREWPPLATKFILADIVAPQGPGSRSHWSEPAMMFLKIHVENRNWKAAPMGTYGEHQGLRLFNSNNKLLATLMIQQELGVAALTYHEAVSMYETLDKQPAFIKPAFNALSAGGGASNVDNTLPLSFAIPATYREHQQEQQEQTTRSNNDCLKNNNDKGNFGKSHYVHPNAKDSNWRTDGAEDAAQSRQRKASSKHCHQRSSSYQAQDTIRNPRGSPPSTSNGEMKGPLRSQKPEKVEERSPTPLVQPDVEISPPDMPSELPKPQSISAVQQPRQSLPVADRRVEDLSETEEIVISFDELPDEKPELRLKGVCQAGKVVEKETTGSNSNYLKRIKDKGNFVQSQNVHSNEKDSNLRTGGAENMAQSGQGKASSKNCNQRSSSYRAQEIIQNPRGSPSSTGNGEMKGPLRSQKPEKVEVKSPAPLVQPDVKKPISAVQLPRQALSDADSRLEDLSQSEIMDIDELPGCSAEKIVEKESVESDSDRFKMSKDKGKCGKSRCAHDATHSVRVNSPSPLVQPAVEISPPAENSQLPKLPPTSAGQKPKKARKDLLTVESVPVKNGPDNNRLKRNKGNDNCGKSHYVLPNTEHSNSRTGGAEDESETVNMDAGLSTISEALLEQSSPSTVGENASKIISSTGDSSDVLVPCEELSSICPLTPDADGTPEESKAEGTIEEFPLLPVNYFVPGQKMSSYALSSYIESATEIWIQLDPAAVDSLMAKIAEMDVSQLETLDPQLQASCLALFPDDGRWYRALINSIDTNQAKVTFVDYGKSSLVNVGDLRVLPSLLTQTSGLALKCALDGTQQNLISSPTSDQCESIIAQEVLTVVFASRSSGHLYVRLLDPSGLDLNEKLGLPESFRIESVASNLLEFNPLDDVEMSSPVARTADPAPLFNIDGDATLPLEVEDVRGVTAEPIVVIPTVLGHSENEKAEMVVNQIEQDVMKPNEFYQCVSDSVNSFVQESIMEPRVGLEAKDVSEQLAIRLMSYQAQEVIRNPRGPPSTGNGEMKGLLQSQRPEKVEERSPTPLVQPAVEIAPSAMLSSKPQPISAVQQPRQAMPVADFRVEDLSDPGAGTARKVENVKVTISAHRNEKRDKKRKVVVGVVPRDDSYVEDFLSEHLFDMDIQD